MATVRFTLALDSKKAKILKTEAKKQGLSFSHYARTLFLQAIKKSNTPKRVIRSRKRIKK